VTDIVAPYMSPARDLAAVRTMLRIMDHIERNHLDKVRYYLGVQVRIVFVRTTEPGWVWAVWPDGRRFKHWAAQLHDRPWGE
jgi:hypothetical protein